MPEIPDEKKQRELKELEGKNIAHYSVLLNSWINTKMERDKALITLSAAGIGLLVTILIARGVNHSYYLLLFAGAFGGFIVTIFSSLRIYELNSQHIESNIRGSSDKDPRLEQYDKRSKYSFAIGVVFSILIAGLSAFDQIETKEDSTMGDKKNSQSISSQTSIKKKSLDGLSNLRPESSQTQSGSQDSNNDNSSSNDSDQKE